MDCQLFHVIFRNKIKVMKREAWASPMTVISSCVCWPCTMQVSRHSYEEPFLFVFKIVTFREKFNLFYHFFQLLPDFYHCPGVEFAVAEEGFTTGFGSSGSMN